jgi:hypothetical protein
MIDITGPKVLVPAILFALLSPGLLLALPPGSGHLIQTLFHAVVFAIASWAILKFVFKFTLTQADMIVPALLFILLTPGVVLTLPPINGIFFTGKTGPVQVATHTFVYAILFATLRGAFPRYY